MTDNSVVPVFFTQRMPRFLVLTRSVAERQQRGGDEPSTSMTSQLSPTRHPTFKAVFDTHRLRYAFRNYPFQAGGQPRYDHGLTRSKKWLTSSFWPRAVSFLPLRNLQHDSSSSREAAALPLTGSHHTTSADSPQFH